MIGIFLGEQNSGKTLSMSYYLNEYYKKGYEIYTNYNVSFPHKKITKTMIMNYTETQQQFKKAVFGIDEIYLFFDSRSFGSKSNRIFSYFVVQSSKRNVHILGTAQFFNTIEKRFRDNTNFQVLCDRVLKLGRKIKPLQSFIRKLSDIENDVLSIRNIFLLKTYNENFDYGIRKKVIYLKAKPLFDMYDTTQLLNISGD